MKGETRSKFIKVKCNDCGNEQVVFGSAASVIKCLVCDKVLAKPRSGKTAFNKDVVEIVESDVS